MNKLHIIELMHSQGWQEIPLTITTREGISFDSSGDIWNLPYSVRDNASLDFSKIIIDEISWSLKYYIKDRIERISTHASYAAFQDVWREFLRHDYTLHLLL